MGRAGLLLLVFAALPQAALAERTLVIESFAARVQVSEDGSIEVTESIRPRFTGAWNGIFRNIPVQYRTPQGLNYTLLLNVVDVRDDEGRGLRYESSRERHYRKLKIWIPGATDTTRSVTLRYRVRNALRFSEEHDELYWNVTGDEWEVPIENAAAEIGLPAGIAGLRAVAFTGGYGSREQAASVEIGTQDVRVRTLRALNFREGLTVAVAWNAGAIPRPSGVQRTAGFLRSNWILVNPIIALGVMLRLWHTRGRDPRLRPIMTRYEPPEGLAPAELGTLVDNSPDMRDITATLVDLAVRGYVVIEETRTEQLLGLWSSTDYGFTLKKAADDGTLRRHERRLLDGLFGEEAKPGARVGLADLKNRFYKHLPAIRRHVFERLISLNHYTRRPDRVRKSYLLGGAILGALIGWGGSALSESLGYAPGAAIAAGAATAAIVCGFGLLMPARTTKGAAALEQALGFEEFLERVESDRVERVVKTPELFEKYLPYAMALGVEDNWAKAFDDIYRQPPEWYRGGDLHGFRAASFANSVGRLSSAAGSAMTSAPRGSGGSGFRGGRSGGGFGGGGGGGF